MITIDLMILLSKGFENYQRKVYFSTLSRVEWDHLLVIVAVWPNHEFATHSEKIYLIIKARGFESSKMTNENISSPQNDINNKEFIRIWPMIYQMATTLNRKSLSTALLCFLINPYFYHFGGYIKYLTFRSQYWF